MSKRRHYKQQRGQIFCISVHIVFNVLAARALPPSTLHTKHITPTVRKTVQVDLASVRLEQTENEEFVEI